MYTAKFYQTWKMVLALVLIPLLIFGITIPLLIAFPPPENLEVIILFLVIFGDMGLSVFVVLRVVNLPCSVTIQSDGLHIILNRKVILYPAEFHVLWSQIRNASGNDDANGNRAFINISSTSRAGSFILYPTREENVDAATWPLWKQIQNHISQHNDGLPEEAQIQRRSFYSGTWAKVMTIICFALFILGLVLKLSGSSAEVSWVSLASLFCFGSLFSFNVIRAAKMKYRNKTHVQSSEKPHTSPQE